MHLFYHSNWRILTVLPENEAKDLFDFVVENGFRTGTWLKKHHRSDVILIPFKNKRLVFKIPKEKNRNRWMRITSLYRKGESFRNIEAMALLSEKNIPTTKPLLAAEKRKYNMVVDSFLLYEYLEGVECLDKEEEFSGVVALLKSIHVMGYLHGDPQIRNFIKNKDGLHVIDSNPTKPFIKRFDEAYEFAYLKRSAPGIEKYFGNIKKSFWYRFASWYDRKDRQLALFRRKIKGLAGLKKTS